VRDAVRVSRYAVVQEGEAFRLRDDQTGTSLVVGPAKGNNVTSLRAPAGGDDPELLLPRGIPILFPFPNRVPGGRYRYGGRDLQLDLNERGRPNHIHGFVRQLPWTVADAAADGDSAWQRSTIALQDHPEVTRQYPFPCRLTVTTRLRDGVLVHEAEVENLGSSRLPMGYGIHPWFRAARGAAREDTAVRIGSRSFWELKDQIPTGRIVEAPSGSARDLRDWRALGGAEYDDVFATPRRRADGWSDARVRYSASGLEITVEASQAFREWVLFAPPGQDALCLEPYTGVTNAVNLGFAGVDAGLVELEPGERWRGVVGIRASLGPG
jgi:aldose 1-epimerase